MATDFFKAFEEENYELVKSLINQNNDLIELKNSRGETIFMTTVRKFTFELENRSERKKLIKFLMEKNCNLYPKDGDHQLSYYLSIIHNHPLIHLIWLKRL